MNAATIADRSPRPGAPRPAQRVEYTLGREVGRGASGLVSLAETSDGRRVIVKALRTAPAPCPSTLRRFGLEAEVMRRIRHPNVMPVLDVRDEGSAPFFVMPLLDGAPLRYVMKHLERPLPLTRALSLLRDLAHALREVHRHGLVHRDVKPDNVFVTTAGAAVLFDFGLVKDETAAEVVDPLVKPGQLLGTPAYMSPEQIRGREVTGATDVYAFGVLATELLMGTNPFFSWNIVESIRWHLELVPAPLEQVAPHRVSSELSRLLARCLLKEPDLRPTSAEVAACLDLARARAAGACRVPTGVSSLPATRATLAPRPPLAPRPDLHRAQAGPVRAVAAALPALGRAGRTPPRR